MADLSTKFCGKVLQSPFILGSGPAGFDAENLYLHYKAGAGAVVTKSISIDGCQNTTRHMMANGRDCLINNEGGSDLPMKQWLDVEIPKAKELGVEVLIASVYGNGNLQDTVHIACECERAGADMLEVVTDYHNPADFVEKIGSIKRKVQIPVIAKVNSNWNNTEEVADACAKSGVDAITAIDSVGPVFRIDIATGKPLMGGRGYGYMTGAPILPIALRYVHDIAGSTTKPILGLGGICSGKDAMEMLMAGASCVGVCSYPIIHGPQAFTKLIRELSELMDQYGYTEVTQVARKTILENNKEDEIVQVRLIKEKCTRCGICLESCPYRARSFTAEGISVDRTLCRKCGLCFGECPVGAVELVSEYEERY